MKTIGIIAEYNPFHNGHAYQIKKIRELTEADYIVVAMSGDFVQRGAPAAIDKYTRAEMALNCGADLIAELPVLWASASAENFAAAGVSLFDQMGCIDGLCFGAETENPDLLSSIAEIFAGEPEDFSLLLSAGLKKGHSFPAARSEALQKYIAATQKQSFPADTLKSLPSAAIESTLNAPNNILAIEYLKALKKRNSGITPLLIRREGAGYHDSTVDMPFASASAIRRLLFAPHSEYIHTALEAALPSAAFSILQQYLSSSPPLEADDFSPILNYLLLSAQRKHDTDAQNPDILSDLGDFNTEIANHILKNRNRFSSFSQFCEINKSKNLTYSRLSRMFVHLLLHITNEDYKKGKALDYIPYIRLLGFKKTASPLLTELKRASHVPILSKLADASVHLGGDALWLLEKDIFASDLYEHTLFQKRISDSGFCQKIRTVPRSEYSRKIVLL